MPYLTHPSGQKTFYLDDDFTDPWKPKETVLIQHGFGRSSAFWYKWVPVLATKYRVIRRDALGHGYSSAPPEGYPDNMDIVLSEIIDTLDQLQVDKVHYLGESTGGIFGHFLGARYPDRIFSVTNCASPLSLNEDAQKALSYGYPSPPESIRALGARGWGKAFVGLTATDQGASKGFMSWWLDQFSIPSVEGLVAYANVVCSKEADARFVMNENTVPVLMLTPAHSSLVNIDDQKAFVAAGENRRMEIVPGHGHEIYFDQAEFCQEKFLEFLDSLRK